MEKGMETRHSRQGKDREGENYTEPTVGRWDQVREEQWVRAGQ